MTLAEINAAVAAILGRDDLSSNINQWVNNRQRLVCREGNFHFMETRATANTVANQQSYSFDTLSPVYKSGLTLYRQDSNSLLRKLARLEDVEPYTITQLHTDTGDPRDYWIWQNAFWLYPIPDAVYTLVAVYYGYLSDLSSGFNHLTIYWPDLLEAGAAADGFNHIGEITMAAVYEKKFVALLAQLKSHQAKRSVTDRTPRLKLRMK